MLQQVCENIHNYFAKGYFSGEFAIYGGAISPLSSFILEGQKFLISGSALNDGMYTYHADGIKDDDDNAFAEGVGLKDETFAGTICVLAVPPAVIALSKEVKAWVETNGDAVTSPYTSENVVGVYSYTKASGGSGAGGAITWADAFRDQLNRWRKVAFL